MTKKPTFVVHEHHASHSHWDFRLQIDGVLKSWAVPKEPPIDVGTKRLAIQVPDHALSYGKFEGEITHGYGKGTVKIWDNGTYEMESMHDSKLVFVLHGKKMKGKYVLVEFPKAKNGWLLFKKD
jgi:DNA ligase D-like protein (predicted 3'-phosphoesterase)